MDVVNTRLLVRVDNIQVQSCPYMGPGTGACTPFFSLSDDGIEHFAIDGNRGVSCRVQPSLLYADISNSFCLL